VLDPILAGAALFTLIAGLWVLRRSPTSAATWFFAAWGLSTTSIALYPLLDVLPAFASTYLACGVLSAGVTLAGVLVLLDRRVPPWLLSTVFAYGVIRTAFLWFDQFTLASALGVPSAALMSLAGAIAILHAPSDDAHRALRTLGPALLVVSVVAMASILSIALAGRAPIPILLAWLAAGPVILGIELYAVAEQRTNALSSSRDALESMVASRTRELAEINESLQREIEERQQAARALARSEERYRTVSELSSDFSFSLRVMPGGGVEREWVTEAFERITGHPPETLDGHHWSALLHGDTRNASDDDLALIRSTNGTNTTRYRIVRPDGEERWLDVKLRRARDETSGRTRVVGAARDVTEAHLSEEARLELERRVEAAQRIESLGMLTGGIAHDFNNLLAVILGNTRLVQEELPAVSPSAPKLARIRSAAEHGARLTEQMLTYSGKAIVSLAPVELSGLVRDLSDLLQASVGRKCSLTVELGTDAVIEGDVTRLSQVILNLVTNAFEALEDGSGNVLIRTGSGVFAADQLSHTTGASDAVPGEYAWFEIIDDGSGMDPETCRRIFEPFFTTKFSGRGLGLASVLGIIRAHGGLVVLDSEVGRGTRVQVLIPSSKRTPELRLAPAPIAPAPERVLIVDDDEAVLELASEFLRRAGYASRRAAGGREAVALFQKNASEIDVVVLDLTMPDMDGREVFRALRNVRADVPVVLATGYSQGTLEENFPEESQVTFLRKPYEPEQLLAAIRRASARPA
jgi:PAS domain S-box-containing protein